MNNLNILITGGAGFIGSNLVLALQARFSSNIVIIDNLSPTCGASPSNCSEVKQNATLVIGDITNPKTIEAHMKTAHIVVNCAAESSHLGAFENADQNFEVNSAAVLHMLQFLQQNNRECKFIQLGTTTQFGAQIQKVATEEHPEFPLDIYSAHKSLAENYCLIFAKKYGLRTTVIRLSNVYGPRARNDTPSLTFNNFFIGQANRGEDINIYDDGTQIRNPLFVDDAVNAIVECMINHELEGQTFIVCGSESLSVREIAEQTVNTFNSGHINFIKFPEDRKRIEIGNSDLSHEKFTSMTGWKPNIDLTEGLQRTRDFLTKNR